MATGEQGSVVPIVGERRDLSPEQVEARERVARHHEILQSGVRRGPNAPKDGTFGGKAA